MGIYVANQVVKLMIRKDKKVEGARVLVLGITFKENCPDIRNSRVIDVIRELQDFGCVVEIYDPWADAEEVSEEYGVGMLSSEREPTICEYDAVVLAVAHRQFVGMPLCPTSTQVVYDIKSVLAESDGSL